MRYRVWVQVPPSERIWRTGPAGPWSPNEWRAVSRPFEHEREAQEWALDLSDWFRARMEIRRVES